ncbi:multiple epidermal growth factor-like domains protein 10 isoform X1 [Saccostrea cucullata]|uniref:multiple epidermal growth factor-like domains protein 10 isoform X1 n=1 Tax=Saccostrea cuccullata TaxID=36930 RepID=UPI002ED1F044
MIYKLDVFCVIGILAYFRRINGKCEGEDGVNCCAGFRWSQATQQCVECLPGYFGINCSATCFFPSYGRHCQKLCNCSSELCDFSTGCFILQFLKRCRRPKTY